MGSGSNDCRKSRRSWMPRPSHVRTSPPRTWRPSPTHAAAHADAPEPGRAGGDAVLKHLVPMMKKMARPLLARRGAAQYPEHDLALAAVDPREGGPLCRPCVTAVLGQSVGHRAVDIMRSSWRKSWFPISLLIDRTPTAVGILGCPAHQWRRSCRCAAPRATYDDSASRSPPGRTKR